MKSVLTAILCWATVLGILGAQPAQAHRRDCFGSLRAALAKGGYSGGLDCYTDKMAIKIRPLGAINVGLWRYRIYQLNYHFKPVPGNDNTHWGERLLVFDRRGRYLGQYGVINYDDRFRIVGHTLLSNQPAKDGNRIIFTPSGLPGAAWLDGEDHSLFR